MTSQLDRRLQKLETAAKGSSGEGRPRIVFVHHGQSAEEEIAKLEDQRLDDHLIIVRFVSPGDLPGPGEALQ